MNHILVVAAHPDDETLGCGGSLLKFKDQGKDMSWLVFTNISEKIGYSEEAVFERQREIEAVSRFYGFSNYINLSLPSARIDTLPKSGIIEKVSKAIHRIKPDALFLPNRSDAHTDHQIVFETTMASTKSFRCPFIKNIFLYETISETEFAPALHEKTFIPNTFSDISDYIDRKIEAMKIYKTEYGEHPFPRSALNLNALAIYRGATAGVKCAEAFMCLKRYI